MSRAAFVLLMAAQLFGGGEKNTREGAEHFESGRLEDALRAFSRAEGAVPDAPENDLNIAGVHYRMGEAEGGPGSAEDGPLAEALRGYQAALQSGLEGGVRRDALFNLGNGLFRAGAFREAAAAYGEAIAQDPEDLEARQNLERALRAADEQEEQPERQPGEGGRDGQEQEEQDEKDEEQQPGEPQLQDQPPGDGQQQNPDSEEPPEPDRETPPRESPRQQEPPAADNPQPDAPPDGSPGADVPEGTPGEVPEVTPEQAERILAALADVERAFQEDRLEKRRARALRRGRH